MTWGELRKRVGRIDVRLLILAVLVGLLVEQSITAVAMFRRDKAISEGLHAIDGRLGALPPAVQAAFLQASVEFDRAKSAPHPSTAADPVTASVPIGTTCGDKVSCTGTFYVAGRCNGQDQVPILQKAWESRPIKIRAVSVGLMLDGKLANSGYALVGNSAHPDIMAQQAGAGASTVSLDPPFDFPATRDDHTHIDVHISCPDGNYQSFVVLYYSVVR